ncbi:MAG: hypothetical protein M1834_006481 [Cirrosporium novae-zelandiae]|nr:MAG: hypothetical protein M1834_006481 [Cirrosporium novae-zelandiae]
MPPTGPKADAVKAPTEDKLIEVSTDGAQKLVESYYNALQTDRGKVDAFYVPPHTTPDGKHKYPFIAINGEVMETSNALKEYLNKMRPVHYEIQTVDSHIINSQYPLGEAGSVKPEKDISILAVVSGDVQFGGTESPKNGFSESFVFVPNKPPKDSKGKGKVAGKDFLIETQNFRVVV